MCLLQYDGGVLLSSLLQLISTTQHKELRKLGRVHALVPPPAHAIRHPCMADKWSDNACMSVAPESVITSQGAVSCRADTASIVSYDCNTAPQRFGTLPAFRQAM